MLSQAIDFKDESEALYTLLKPLSDADFNQKTLFKDWTLSDILEHLHMWNWAANESLVNEEGFVRFIEKAMPSIVNSGSIKTFERDWIDGLSGQALLEAWRDFYLETSERFINADPKKRLKWAGPDMSVRSSITARLMETWAHGQAAYDALGVVRENTDRIKNIAVLGVNTYGWTYAARSDTPPGSMPFVKLVAPSGDVWEFGEPSESERVEGLAVDFCQVVTQVRNIGDTALKVKGDIASDWMSKAQCFAGPPETPPATGFRHTKKK